jgi:hypothetical protein
MEVLRGCMLCEKVHSGKCFDRWFAVGFDQDTEMDKMHEQLPGKWSISGSIVADMCGLGYKSRAKRFRLMTGAEKEIESEFEQMIKAKGNELEGVAIMDFYSKFPQFCGVKPGWSHFNEEQKASLDQLIFKKNDLSYRAVLEIKCRTESEKQLREAKDFTRQDKLNWIIQVHWEMKCKCYLVD